MTRLRVACDVGGTFTDICVLDEDDGVDRGREGAVDAGRPDRGGHRRRARPPASTCATSSVFSHGTTVATNALITRSFPRAAMVDDPGLPRRDRDPPRHEGRPLGRLQGRRAAVHPPPRPLRGDASASTTPARCVEPLDEDEARRVAAVLRERGVETVAVCFINAYANPANEHRMREILEEELPGVDVSTSSEILPEIFEHERFSTTVANAVLSPLVGGYVRAAPRAARARAATTATCCCCTPAAA